MNEKPTPRHSMFAVWRWPRWMWVVASIPSIVLTAYLLSFALMARLFPDPSDILGISEVHFWRIYSPANWVIDHTPLQTPLLKWAEFWGVEGEFYFEAARRQRPRTPID